MALSQNKISKKKQKNLRNILGLNEKTFWPVASESEGLALNLKLKSCLKAARINVPRVPWFKTRLLSKEDRNKANKELLMSQTPEKIEAYHYALKLRQLLFLGINSLCKGIEKDKVSACLLDADVIPKILVTHAMELANNSNVPILAVSNLKETFKRTLGFSSMAIGFHKDVLEDKTNNFHEVCSYIIELSKSTESENVKTSTMDLIPPCITKVKAEPPPLDIQSLLKNIYLLRESEDVRVFKPPANDSTPTDQEMPEDNSIKLTSISVDVVEPISKLRYFKPLVVNRIQSNPKKKKKKSAKKK